MKMDSSILVPRQMNVMPTRPGKTLSLCTYVSESSVEHNFVTIPGLTSKIRKTAVVGQPRLAGRLVLSYA